MATAAIDFAFVKSAHASSGQFVDFDEQLEVCRSEVWRNEFEDIIGTSRALGEVLEQVRIVAPTGIRRWTERKSGHRVGGEQFRRCLRASH